MGEDTDDEVKEVEAQPKSASDFANLRILFHRTPEGVGANGDIHGKHAFKIVKLPRHMYPTNSGMTRS